MQEPKDEAFRLVLVARANGDSAYLIEALRDADVAARSFAARSLGKLGATESIPALRRLLNAANPRVRSAGAQALGRLRASEAVPDLISMAQNDPDLAPQTHAIWALAQIGDKRAQSVLVALLKSQSWLVRSGAAWALGLFADSTVLAALRKARKQDAWFGRWEYRKAMRRIRRRTRK
jgi:HEAT repeat protein